MAEDDPSYRIRLRGLGSEALVRAMEEGDWSVVEGAYFDCFRADLHVIEPFAIPEWWVRIRAFDWGSAKPFSYGEYVVSDGSLVDGRCYPAGALIKVWEWYGCLRKEGGVAVPDTGLKLSAAAVARVIKEKRGDYRFSRSVADPSMFRVDGGVSIAEAMEREGVIWDRADNSRVARLGALGGWNQVRDRLIGDGEVVGEADPMLYFFKTCRDTIRTLPALQHDEMNPEDLDTNGEDHAADETRYACMSRPYHRSKPIDLPEKKMNDLTINDLWELEKTNGARI